MKKLLTFVKPVIRGAIKSIPGGNVVTEILGNMKPQAAPDAPKPHNWLSIATQIICIAAIIYAFLSHTITLDDLLKDFGFEK